VSCFYFNRRFIHTPKLQSVQGFPLGGGDKAGLQKLNE